SAPTRIFLRRRIQRDGLAGAPLFFARAPDDAGPPSPVSPPRFAPPLEARPSTLYVTRIGKLLRDPYGVYASQVLKLKKRDPLGDPFGPRHIGNLFHAVFERFAAAHPKDMPADATTALLRLFDDAADHHGMTPADRVFWRRASLAALEWFAGFHADRLDRGEPAVIEGDGAWAFDIDGARFTLRARADRIDATGTGGFTVFDYKSKTLPSIDQIKSDFNPQLPLTALIAERGGFDALKNAAVEGFFYLRVLDRRAARGKADVGLDGAAAVEAVRAAEEGLRSLIAHYRNPQTPYLSQPRPEFLDDWGDYDHLARRREWSASGGEE
ncbi:MAG: PD-(D/E)XK nuclease family protein, partial [Pseudomonadota bacterium]